MSWSRKHDRCQGCGTTERRHMALGLCIRCYSNHHYHKDIEAQRRKRSMRLATMPDDKYAAKYARELAWKRANRERHAASKAEWYRRQADKLCKWPVGATVWAFYAGFWCRGTIAQRVNNLRIEVELLGGTRLSVGLRKAEGIRRDRPVEVAP